MEFCIRQQYIQGLRISKGLLYTNIMCYYIGTLYYIRMSVCNIKIPTVQLMSKLTARIDQNAYLARFLRGTKSYTCLMRE